MLEPNARTLLFDILRPPDDYRLDIALATTYTLDLLALLTAPVAFSMFEAEDETELLKGDSLALLESLRRYADRIIVFCQAGKIAFPKVRFPQLEYLERSIIQCRRPAPGASFHPKLWLLRFVGCDGAVRYRLACLTRNLTFDRCWDTSLTMEGSLLKRQNAIAVNNPLGDFIEFLPSQTFERLSPETARRVDQVQSEVRRVQFQVPEGFDEYRFHPLGMGRRRSIPFDETDRRMLLISPFASQEGIHRITAGRAGSILVTRPETLAEGVCQSPDIERYFVLANEASPATDDDDDSLASRGLHAKCYIVDDGWKAHVWTGSANATESGFSSNVEFLVELTGPKSKFGIDAVLSKRNGETDFAHLLQEDFPPSQPAVRDEVADTLRAAIDQVRDSLAAAGLKAMISEGEGSFDLKMTSHDPLADVGSEVKVLCWPVTVGKGRSRQIQAGPVDISFPGLSVEGLSGFIAFEVRAARESREFTETFVLNLPLEGAPSDRRQRLLQAFVKDRRRLIQYFLLLLAKDGIELAERIRIQRRHVHGNVEADAFQSGALLEVLVRTLGESPERLDYLSTLVEDIRKLKDGPDLLPAEFDSVWGPIWAIRQEMKACAV